jgi:hypothetical protein
MVSSDSAGWRVSALLPAQSVRELPICTKWQLTLEIVAICAEFEGKESALMICL